MSHGPTTKYRIAGKNYSIRLTSVVNKLIKTVAAFIPGYPPGRNFSDAGFNMIFRAIATEIELVEKETDPRRDIVSFFTKTYCS